MSIYAIIPARGGSKGLPGKNICMLNGKPLLAWTIEAANAAEYVDKVFVSTDSGKIGREAEKLGAIVIPRPENISGDQASSESALIHALQYMQENGLHLPEILVFLQCTAPLMSSEDIDGTIKALNNGHFDSALAVAPFYHFLWKNSQLGAEGINHDGKNRCRRQDLSPQYLEAGSVYAMRVDSFLKEKSRFCGRTALYVISDHHRCLEIDDYADLHNAEAMQKIMKL